MHINVEENYYKNRDKLILLITILTSIFLNHSNRDIGVNLSISDIFLFISVLLLIIKKDLLLPGYHTMFFMLLSCIMLTVSILYTPFRFNIITNYSGIFIDFIKILACLLFFLLGYNLPRLDLMKVSIKWYSLAAMLISAIGLLFKLLNFDYLYKVIFAGAARFSGLMVDPNYYSVIQCTALVYFLRNDKISKINKIVIYLINFIFISMSASKTGMVTLAIYTAFILIEYLMISKKTFKSALIVLVLLIVIIVLMPLISSLLNNISNAIISYIPKFERIKILFADIFLDVNLRSPSSIKNIFKNIINIMTDGSKGSKRSLTWTIGLGIFKKSPIFGIGFGSFRTISLLLYGKEFVAHNTYLQIFAEWGGIMATIFFIYVFVLLAKSFYKRKERPSDNIITTLRDIVLILLIGSLAISLNNARMFWMFFGGLVYYVMNEV